MVATTVCASRGPCSGAAAISRVSIKTSRCSVSVSACVSVSVSVRVRVRVSVSISAFVSASVFVSGSVSVSVSDMKKRFMWEMGARIYR